MTENDLDAIYKRKQKVANNEMDILLERINKTFPERGNWADIGDMDRIISHLQELTKPEQ